MNRMVKLIRFTLSFSLALLVGTEPALASLAYAAGPVQEMPVSLPPQMGWLTDSFSIRKDNTRPDVILIQDLHVNRSVQFAISKLLGYLESLNLLPETIAIEGSTGPVDVSGLQQMGSPKERKKAADYLVEQGEMPGDVHYVVTQGKGKLYGVEDADSYQGILTTYQKTYEARTNLVKMLVKAEKAIQRLKRRGESDTVQQNAMMLEVDIQALKKLLAHEVTPDELKPTVQRMLQSLPRLEKVLPKDDIKELALSVSGSVNFYTLALMRDESMHKNLLKLRKQEKQQTSILVVGGFHTPGLTKQFKKDGLSYWVITPNVRKHTKTDEKLYVERMMGRHLTSEQVAKGYDWSALLAKPFYSGALMTSLLAGRLKTIAKNGIQGFVLVGSAFLLNSVMPGGDVMALSQPATEIAPIANEGASGLSEILGNIIALILALSPIAIPYLLVRLRAHFKSTHTTQSIIPFIFMSGLVAGQSIPVVSAVLGLITAIGAWLGYRIVDAILAYYRNIGDTRALARALAEKISTRDFIKALWSDTKLQEFVATADGLIPHLLKSKNEAEKLKQIRRAILAAA